MLCMHRFCYGLIFINKFIKYSRVNDPYYDVKYISLYLSLSFFSFFFILMTFFVFIYIIYLIKYLLNFFYLYFNLKKKLTFIPRVFLEKKNYNS